MNSKRKTATHLEAKMWALSQNQGFTRTNTLTGVIA